MLVKFNTDFWDNPIVVDDMTPSDKYFYLYLITNKFCNSIGIYKLPKNKISFDLGYDMNTVDLLINKFENEFKLIKYSTKTKEVIIKDYFKSFCNKINDLTILCFERDFKEVQDKTLFDEIELKNLDKKIQTIINNIK